MAAFEDDLKKLEAVVDRLERGDLTLEQSVKLFEDGIRLSNACKTQLDAAEGRIQVLVQGKKGSMQPADMDLPEDAAGVADEEEDES